MTTYRDFANNILSEGDSVCIGLGLGQSILGTVQKTDSLVQNDPKASQMIHVAVVFTLPASPSGLVPGVFKTAEPEPQVAS